MGIENQGHIDVIRMSIAHLRGQIEDPWTDPERRKELRKKLREEQADLRRQEARA